MKILYKGAQLTIDEHVIEFPQIISKIIPATQKILVVILSQENASLKLMNSRNVYGVDLFDKRIAWRVSGGIGKFGCTGASFDGVVLKACGWDECDCDIDINTGDIIKKRIGK